MGAAHRFDFGIRLLGLLSIAHAAMVLVDWWGVHYAHFSIFFGRTWLVLAWLWLAWPLILGLHPVRSVSLALVPSAIGGLLLAPCVPTIFALTIWSVRGFAP
jgi:hypothetical protein